MNPQNRTARTHITRIAAAAVLALSLAACSTDSTDSDGADKQSPTTPTSESTRTASAVMVSEPWARGTVGAKDPSMSAVFLMLDNRGKADVRLESASTEVAARAELHAMTTKDGAMVMQRVDGGITVKAGKDMLLQPGGFHIMLMDLTGELVPGTEIEIRLGFSDGSSQSVTVPVKEFTEEEGHYHEPGAPEHTHGGDDQVAKP